MVCRTLTGLFLATCVIGCAPNTNGVWRPTLPWTRQMPNASSPNSATNPWQNPSSAYPPPDPTRQSSLPPAAVQSADGRSFFQNLMRRADQQETLAERQRQEIAELSRLQTERQKNARDYVIAQREKERADLARQYKEKERLLAEREKKYRGQFDKIRSRATDLDANNRDLYSELARQQKQNKLLEDELNLLKSRLGEATQQLELAQLARDEQSQQVQALQASASQRRGKAAIRANRSVTKAITAVTVPGMDVRQDGDLVRISIPSDKLFRSRTAQLHQGALPYMDQIADVLRQHYPTANCGYRSAYGS